MDLLNHMLGFFVAMRTDPSLTTHEIAILVALYDKWNQEYRPSEPFPVNRKEIMQLAKIGNGGTYTNCLKALHGRYIIYIPGNLPKPALISIIYLGEKKNIRASTGINSVPEMPTNGSRTATNTVSEVEPIKKEKDIKSFKSNTQLNKKNKEEPERHSLPADSKLTPPTLSELEILFEDRGYPKEQANKFFVVNSARNWKDKNGRSIDLIKWIDGWMKLKKDNGDKSGIDIDSRKVIQHMYQKFQSGKNVETEIRVEYYRILKLTIDASSIENARKIRMNRLMSSSEGNDSRLLRAYNNEIEGAEEIVQNDFEVVNRIAAQQVVLNYFKECQIIGKQYLFDS